MKLLETIKDAKNRGIALGHFNFSDIAGLNAIIKAARDLNVPIILGVSEGEVGFVGIKRAAALIKSAREEFGHPIFLNADHFHSLESAKKAAEAGFDSILFDGTKLSLQENMKITKEIVSVAKSINPNILIEAEIGYIGTSSEIREHIPEGAAINEADLTKPSEAQDFVRKTGIDFFGPAVGNVHGMMMSGFDPDLNIGRIKEIAEAIPETALVLHGGSGNKDEDFVNAIKAGIRIIHINTEIRLAWREALQKSLVDNPNEVAPYKLLKLSEEAVYEVASRRLKLFAKL